MESWNHEHQEIHLKFSHTEDIENPNVTDTKKYVAYVFTLSEAGQKVMDIISEGRYSDLPKWYKAWFSETMPIKDQYDKAIKHAVVYKRPQLKKMLEESLNVRIEDRTELESKPLLREEILGYPYAETEEELDIKTRIDYEEKFLNKVRRMTIAEKFKDLREVEEKTQILIESLKQKREAKEAKEEEKKQKEKENNITITNNELV